MAEYLSASAASVRASFEKFELWDGRVVIVAGLFEDALPRFDPAARVAVLRVDCNFYACHQDALYHLYERVPVGGIVIFDDILAHGELLRFWVEFKTEQGLREVLVRAGDDNCAWFRKEEDVALDWSHFRGPEQLAGLRLNGDVPFTNGTSQAREWHQRPPRPGLHGRRRPAGTLISVPRSQEGPCG